MPYLFTTIPSETELINVTIDSIEDLKMLSTLVLKDYIKNARSTLLVNEMTVFTRTNMNLTFAKVLQEFQSIECSIFQQSDSSCTKFHMSLCYEQKRMRI